MKRKIQQINNSKIFVYLPFEEVKRVLGWEKGLEVEVDIDKRKEQITIRKLTNEGTSANGTVSNAQQ